MRKVLSICGVVVLAAACSTPHPQANPQAQPQADNGLVPCMAEVTGSHIPRKALCSRGQSSQTMTDSWQDAEILKGPGAPNATAKSH